MSQIDDFLKSQRPMVIAHRGFSGRAPENTLSAIRMAIDVGVDMVEVDITLTADRHLVVIHDETLARTTDGTGRVQASTLAEIRALDAGSWFDRRFAGERVPTLAEVLDLAKDQILLNLEIKPEAVSDETRDGVAGKLVRLVQQKGMVEQVIISSFDSRALIQARALAPEIRRASLFNRQIHRGRLPSEITNDVSAKAFHISQFYLTRAMFKNAQKHGLPVMVYTVNRAWRMRRLIHLGAHAVFTDHPNRMIKLLKRRQRRALKRASS